MNGPAPVAKSLKKLAKKWSELRRREKTLEKERKALGVELLPLLRPLGELVLEDGSAVSIERGSTRADATLTRIAGHFGADKAKAFWDALPENGFERLHLREAPASAEKGQVS